MQAALLHNWTYSSGEGQPRSQHVQVLKAKSRQVPGQGRRMANMLQSRDRVKELDLCLRTLGLCVDPGSSWMALRRELLGLGDLVGA